MSSRAADISSRFTKLRALRDKAWAAHTDKRHRLALEYAADLELCAMELRSLLHEDNEAQQDRVVG